MKGISISIQIRNTQKLVDPAHFRFVGLIYSLPGTGKTTFVGTCPPEDTGIAACDRGAGSGLLSIADKGFDYIEPENIGDVEKFIDGQVFPDKKILVLDNLSTLAHTIIRETALSIPLNGSAGRKYGAPDLADYKVINELVRRVCNRLIDKNPAKHIIVCAHEKYDRPNENDAPGTESLIGPELSGQLFTAAPSMFDFVLRLRTRSLLRNPADPKSRYSQRFFQTNQERGVIAKCRATKDDKPLLDPEEIFDLETKQGGFPYLLNKIAKGYVS